jgi:raffinose/stachyose/melibiose transport system substrate-binding protein
VNAIAAISNRVFARDGFAVRLAESTQRHIARPAMAHERLTMTFSSIPGRRRHALLAVASGAGLALALTACGGSANPASGGSAGAEPQTITFTYATANPKETYYETLANDFEAANPGVTVKTNKIALSAADQTIPTQLQGGNGPDVFWLNAGSGQQDSIGQLAKGGLLLELPKEVHQHISEAEMAGYSVNGKTYGVPSSTQVLGYILNDELAKANGVNITTSSTLDDIIAQCPAVAQKGLSIFGLAGSVPQNPGLMSVEIATSTVYGSNPTWNDDRAAGKTTFAATPGWQQALQAIVDMSKAGCFQKGAAGAGFDALTNGAAQGKLFGFFAPGGAAKDIMAAAGGHVTLQVMAMAAPAGASQMVSISSNTGLAGSAKTKSPKLVQKFLAFSTTPAEAKKVAEDQGAIPIGAKSADELLPQYAPVAPLFGGDTTRPFPVDGWPNGQVYNALGTGVTGLLTGQKTVDDVLKAMDQAWG